MIELIRSDYYSCIPYETRPAPNVEQLIIANNILYAFLNGHGECSGIFT
jgi:hypothetical protein